MMINEYLTKKETEEYFQVSERTIERWVKSGKLPALRAGRIFRISKITLEDIKNGKLEIK